MIGDFIQEVKTLDGFGSIDIKPMLVNVKSLPAASYSTRNGVATLYYKGSMDLKETNIDFNIYSSSYSALRALQDTFITHFHGFSGQLNNNTYVSRIEVTNTLEALEEHNQTIYRVIIYLELTQ